MCVVHYYPLVAIPIGKITTNGMGHPTFRFRHGYELNMGSNMISGWRFQTFFIFHGNYIG